MKHAGILLTVKKKSRPADHSIIPIPLPLKRNPEKDVRDAEAKFLRRNNNWPRERYVYWCNITTSRCFSILYTGIWNKLESWKIASGELLGVKQCSDIGNIKKKESGRLVHISLASRKCITHVYLVFLLKNENVSLEYFQEQSKSRYMYRSGHSKLLRHKPAMFFFLANSI